MMSLKPLMNRAGKVSVNLGPLLILMGSAMSATNGEIEPFLEALFTDLSEEDE